MSFVQENLSRFQNKRLIITGHQTFERNASDFIRITTNNHHLHKTQGNVSVITGDLNQDHDCCKE